MDKEDYPVNNGEHLYYKNMAHNFLRQSKIEEKKKNEEDNFTMEFNFQPHFLKTETDNYSNVKSRYYRESIPIYKYVDENETFQPNKNTKKIQLKGEDDINRMTNRLYSEQKKFRENKEKLSKNQIEEKCPFKPTINVPGKADPKYFMLRLEKWNKKIEEKNKESMDKKNNLSSLGKGSDKSKLFQPIVKDPLTKKIKRENEVHIDLYNKGLEHINYRKSIMTTDKREDLTKIENDKKEKIKTLKEEREKYKKEKKEKMEKEINERTLKAKALKENLEKIIKERTEQIMNEKEKEKRESKKLQQEKGKKEGKTVVNNNKEKNDTKEKNIKKDNQEKNILKAKPKKEEKIPDKILIKEKENNNEKKTSSTKQSVNTESSKQTTKKELKAIKETNIIKKEKETNKKIEKKERNTSQPQSRKKKPEIIQKEKVSKTIMTSKEEKEKNKKKGNKNDKSYSKKLKTVRNLLYKNNEIIGELEFNNNKNNKKSNANHKNANEYNVVSVGSKATKIKKEKNGKK